MKEALIKIHQFLEDKFMNFTDFELQEEITSYWGVTYSRYEWLLEIVAHRETAYRYVNDKRLSSF